MKLFRPLRSVKCFNRFLSSVSSTPEDALPKTPLFPTKARGTGEALAFIDYKRAKFMGGNGGNGMVSFLREYGVPFGGPDGGNGGNGGHVILKATSKVTDLAHINSMNKAKNGEPGGTKCCHGKNAEHVVVEIPLSTIIKDEQTDRVIHELIEEDEIFIVARGGVGGHGNNFYVSNQVRKPIKAEFGGLGEHFWYALEMRVMATAGLIGFPNAGKSTFLRSISRAKPKVAVYPFTTLKPHVGIVSYEDFAQVAVADIPGLVEGAHRNIGLGFSFLKHVKRCHTLFYVIDYGVGVWREQFDALREELRLYSPELMEKKTTIIVNKVDLMKSEDEKQEVRQLFSDFPDLFFVSAKDSVGLIPVMEHLRSEYDDYLLQQQQRIKERKFEFI
ncbi:GTP-binding subdomain and GTP-binding protein domain containing protein [Aphelenchoides bicaudatus]|nr:GTP-binding subdomain and GTP-binding protein domain containing protein [Aphelenchoides bicaudatus]